MRTIKFRAWSKQSKMWWPEGTIVRVTLGGDLINELKDSFELCQFTGLTDKNGKEIYEGDLIRVTSAPGKDAFGEEMPDHDVIAKVFFKDGAFQTDFYNSLLRIALPGNWQVEVIGNIYENPELRSVSDSESDAITN
jgi:uncharacterized phage protein (TIGR01671 family)